MATKKERGPASGNATFSRYDSGKMVMSPQCHRDATFRMFFVPFSSKAGHMELRCSECDNWYADIRVGKR